MENNEFSLNLGGSSETAGCVSVSCYFPILSESNSEKNIRINKFMGFEEESGPFFDNPLSKLDYKKRMIGKIKKI